MALPTTKQSNWIPREVEIPLARPSSESGVVKQTESSQCEVLSISLGLIHLTRSLSLFLEAASHAIIHNSQ